MLQMTTSQRVICTIYSCLLILGIGEFSSVSKCYAQTMQQVTVFEHGQDGYHTFRIPVLVRAGDGAILAICEGRKNNGSDTGDIDIVLKRSTDEGKTWGPLIVAVDFKEDTIGNPSPILIQETGRIVMLCNHNHGEDDQREIQLRTGTGSRTAWVTHSDDHGKTWTKPVDISYQLKHPKGKWLAFGPAHGIRLTRGKYAGRLVVGAVENGAGKNGIFSVYSDDQGESWKRGKVLETKFPLFPSESVAIELVDGQVYMNSRNRDGHERGRVAAYSSNGGESFHKSEHATKLIEPVVQASVLRRFAKDQGDKDNEILFSNPAHASARRKMTVRQSFDETQSWTDGKLIFRGHSAYSDLITLKQGAAVFYEHGFARRYERINFVYWPTGWLNQTELVEFKLNSLPNRQTIVSTKGHPIVAEVIGSPKSILLKDSMPKKIQTLASFKTNKVWRFDGKRDCLTIPDQAHSLFDFESEDSYSIEVVFRTASHKGKDFGALVSKDKGRGEPSYYLRIENGNLRFFLSDKDAPWSITAKRNNNVSDGNWHHVIVSRNSVDHRLKLFLDGKLVASSYDRTRDDIANDQNLTIGAFNNSNKRYFHGDIALVRIHDRAIVPAK